MSEQEIPIDIAVRKLVDWLISRRLCQKDWHQHVTAIRFIVSLSIVDLLSQPVPCSGLGWERQCETCRSIKALPPCFLERTSTTSTASKLLRSLRRRRRIVRISLGSMAASE